MKKRTAILTALGLVVVCAGLVITFFTLKGGGKEPEKTVLAGLQSVDGEHYYYDAAGSPQFGWHLIDNHRYYFDPVTGAAVQGWFTDSEGEIYYFGEEGYALTGTVTIDGKEYTFDEMGRLQKAAGVSTEYTWKTENGKTYCFGPDGNPLTGLAEVEGALYYFDADGVRQTGWQTIDGGRYYFHPETGRAARGWSTIDGNTYYFDENGKAVTGSVSINGVPYTFNEKGVLVQNKTAPSSSGSAPASSSPPAALNPAPAKPESGDTQATGEWVGKKYRLPNGKWASGLVTIDGKLYGFDANNERVSGRVAFGGQYYHFDNKTGVAQTGWLTDPSDDKIWYFYSESGPALTDMQVFGDGSRYYFDPTTGARQSGLVELSGKTYYFGGKNDAAVIGWADVATGDGLQAADESAAPRYYFCDEGYAVTGVQKLEDGKLYAFTEKGLQLVGWQNVEGKRYLFSGDGGSALANQWADHADGTAYLGADGAALTSLQTIDGSKYYFDPHGIGQSGWVTVDGARYCFEGARGAAITGEWRESPTGKCYLSADGTAATGAVTVDGVLYGFASDGVLLKGVNTIDGKLYFLDDETGAAKTGWQKDGAKVYYVGENGFAMGGVHPVDGKQYYFNPSSFIRMGGWVEHDGKVYLFDGEDQSARTGVYTLGGATYYFGADGAALTGVQKLDGAYYYYNSKGVRQTGWQSAAGYRYYFDPGTAAARIGWFTDIAQGGVYYFSSEGRALTGTQTLDGITYRFDSNGRLAPESAEGDGSWVTTDGKTYYVNTEGKTVTGLQNIGGALYYFDNSGVRQSGWIETKGARYYFDAADDCKAVSGWFTDEGSEAVYYFGADGAAYTGVHEIDKALYYFAPKTAIKSTGMVVESGARYYFDPANGGKARTGWHTLEDDEGASETRYYDKSNWMALTGMQAVEGALYLFNDAGVRQSGWHKDASGLIYRFSGPNDAAVTGKYTNDEGTWYFTEGGYVLVGLASLEEGQPPCYFDAEGLMQTGWQRIGGNRYYFSEGGPALTGEQKLGDDSYYFHNPDGYALTGMHEIDGRTYVFDEDGRLISKEATTGLAWVEKDGKLYYIDSAGEHPTGLEILGGALYLFDTDGSVITGWQTLDGKRYHFAADGKADLGWYKEGDATWYFGDDGAALTGEHTLGGKDYVFDGEGRLTSGAAPVFATWVANADGSFSYHDTTGALATGLRGIGGKWYYFDVEGIGQGGWQTVDDARYYFGGEKNCALTGWQQIEGRWYLFDGATAKQLVGWQYRPAGEGVTYTHYYDPATGKTPEGLGEVNGALRYFDTDGHMVTGWLDTEAGRTYFYQNGERASGVVTIEGALYSFDKNGIMATGWNKSQDGGRYYFTEQGAAKGWFTVDGRWYYASETTFRQQTGWQYRPAGNGLTHTFYYNADGSLPEAGFSTVLGVRRYFDADGHMAAGWQKNDGKLYYFTTKGEQVSGQTTIEGVSYPFGADGSLPEGWHTAGANRYHFTETGALKGWHQLETDGAMVWYRFDEARAVQLTGWQTRQAENGAVKHHFSSAGEATRGWQDTAEGKRWFAADGTMATGWIKVDDLDYYFQPGTGLMATGVVEIDGESHSFDENGQQSEGWVTDGGERYYFLGGSKLTGWRKINENGAERWYHFSAETGAQQLGWQKHAMSDKSLYYYYFTVGENAGSLPAAGWTTAIDGVNRYVMADGQLAQGLLTVDSKLLRFDEKGAFYTGWAEIDDRWYRHDDDGTVLTGWQVRVTHGGEEKDYYYNTDGTLPEPGVFAIDGVNCYIKEDGEVAQGWLMVGEYKYYYTRKGAFVTGKQTIDGIDYRFDSQGRYVEPPSFAKVTWDKGWAASKNVYVTAEVSKVLADKAVKYSFDGGKTWKTSTTGSFEQPYTVGSNGKTIKANTIMVEDSIGNVSSYGSAIKLEGTFSKGHGIDVSAFQGNINWKAVADSGMVEFAIIRGLTWSSAKGYYVIDDKFDYNVRQAKAYGIKVGAYLYSYAFNGSEMKEEVDYFMNSSQVKALVNEGIYFDLPVYIDYEDNWIIDNTPGRTKAQRTDDLLAGLKRIEAAHGGKFNGGVYASLSWCNNIFNAGTIQDKGYSLWVARWSTTATSSGWTYKQPDIWQYTSDKEWEGYPRIPGINARVDRNWLLKDFSGSIDPGNTPEPVTEDNYKLTVTNQNGKVVEGYAKDILAQIVMAEVGGMNNAEVFKAQAIAAHSWLQYQYSDGYKAPSVALKAPTDAVKNAVEAVAGIILEYNGSAALTPYYAASNGYTNDAKYWNTANNLPYLRCVVSPYEGTYSSTEHKVTVTETVLKAKLKTIYGTDITSGHAAKDWIKVTSKNEGGYVMGLNLCGRTPKVDYFITSIVPGINSPSFKVSYADGTFTFTWQGNGHGIGMSQRGAQGYAAKGYTYDKILAHYYPGTALKALF